MTIRITPPRPTFTVDKEMITPEFASDMLENHNPQNRTLHENTWKKYHKMILGGLWMANGDTIVLDTNGDLLNGQHRLKAIKESDRNVWVIVVRGIASEAFVTYDSGKRRDNADQISIHTSANAGGSFPDPQDVASALGLVESYFNKQIKINRWEGLDNQEVVESFNKRQGIQQSRNDCRRWKEAGSRRDTGLTYANLIGCHYLFAQASNIDMATDFMKKVLDGANLSENDPVFRLRQYFKNKGKDLKRGERIILLMRTWNAALMSQSQELPKSHWKMDDKSPVIDKLAGGTL